YKQGSREENRMSKRTFHQEGHVVDEWKPVRERSLVTTILIQFSVFLVLVFLLIGLILFVLYAIFHPGDIPRLATSFINGLVLIFAYIPWILGILTVLGIAYLALRVLPLLGDALIKFGEVADKFIETFEKFLML